MGCEGLSRKHGAQGARIQKLSARPASHTRIRFTNCGLGRNMMKGGRNARGWLGTGRVTNKARGPHIGTHTQAHNAGDTSRIMIFQKIGVHVSFLFGRSEREAAHALWSSTATVLLLRPPPEHDARPPQKQSWKGQKKKEKKKKDTKKKEKSYKQNEAEAGSIPSPVVLTIN